MPPLSIFLHNLHFTLSEFEGSANTLYSHPTSSEARFNGLSDWVDDSGLNAPFMTYAVNYWGDNDLYRQRPYGGGVDFKTGSSCKSESTSNHDAFGHYMNNNFACTNSFDTPLMIAPVPGMIEAKMLNSVEWPGSQNTCTSKL